MAENSIISRMRAKLRNLGCKIAKGSMFVFGGNVSAEVKTEAIQLGFKVINNQNQTGNETNSK